jgi:hypothetical protein
VVLAASVVNPNIYTNLDGTISMVRGYVKQREKRKTDFGFFLN